MSPLKIFTDQERHVKFLKDFIRLKFNKALSENSFIKLSGMQNITFAHQHFSTNTALGGINLVIIDGHLDIQREHEMLNEAKNRFGIQFDYFIFPNNRKDSGKLEDLLQLIIPARYDKLKECFKEYEEKVLSASLNDAAANFGIPSPIGRIYAYLDSALDSTEKEMMNADSRNYTNKYWDMHSSAADDLARFLSQHFNQ